MKLLPGIAICLALAVAAYVFGHEIPIVGGPVFGIVLGMIVATVRRPAPRLHPGIRFSSKFVLQASIVLFGATFDLGQVIHTGLGSLPVMLGTLVITLGAAYILGRMLGTATVLRTLIGVGTAICGASAIAAVCGVLEADGPEIAYAISTIFLFNIVAVLIFPALGHLMGLSQSAFGLWAGTAINDTSSVVAAGFAYGHEAAAQAVVVKLTRTTLIVPIVLALGIIRIARERHSGSVDWAADIPWFIV
ncbi:MAG: putative sulfate exporter family transporter, partial [Candidatus Eremiobacteraeota bacterium]|nr:putative sulfate exporter family transporter [Candidatus Eremiobacteraeota bacterium]